MPVVQNVRESSERGRRKKPVQISIEKAQGDAEEVRVGSLTLRLRAPKSRPARRLHQMIWQSWPDLLLAAATSDEEGKGIDAELTARTLTLYRNVLRQRLAEDDPEVAALPQIEITAADVRRSCRDLTLEIGEEASERGEGEADFLSRICETLWPLASETPGLAWPRPPRPAAPTSSPGEMGSAEGHAEGAPWTPAPPEGAQWLDDALAENLDLHEFADLLRAMLLAMGGFPGDVSDRFTTP